MFGPLKQTLTGIHYLTMTHASIITHYLNYLMAQGILTKTVRIRPYDPQLKRTAVQKIMQKHKRVYAKAKQTDPRWLSQLTHNVLVTFAKGPKIVRLDLMITF